MERKIPGIMIAAVKSGSGKTTLTCALLDRLKERGYRPCAFKCGPDYIDPVFHREVIGVPSCNLDSFFLEEESLRRLYAEKAETGGIAVTEGVMGLYDGLGGIREEGSAYHVASVLGLPVLLVADAHGMGRSLLPLLAGFRQYDREKRIAGVILNKTSRHFYEHIAPAIEEELGLPVLGYLPKKQEFILESRHLGLKLPEERKAMGEWIRRAGEMAEETIDLDRIIRLADQADILELPETIPLEKGPECRKQKVRIGVARDEAFCFYYEENLRLLEELGAELIEFSPLHHRQLPKGLDGILLGGGYPELYGERLDRNRFMREEVRAAIAGGMPSVAECGGFLYLHRVLTDKAGNRYRMCGVIEGDCFYTGGLVRFGYLELEEKQPLFLKQGGRIRGHEFHYYDSGQNGQDCTARKPVTERSWDCIHSSENHFWGFPHLYYPSNPDFAAHFIAEARKFREETGRNVKGMPIA